MIEVIEREVTYTKKEALEIKGITLLSIEEYDEAKWYIPAFEKELWWLRSPSDDCDPLVTYVNYWSFIDHHGCYAHNELGVRPVLIYKSSNLNEEDKFYLRGHLWTVISDHLAMCDDIIGKHCFRKDDTAADANDYEKSDVKKYIENWLEGK